MKDSENPEAWKPLDYSKYEYPDELPKGYYWMHEQEWSCPDHEYDVNEEGDYDCPNECCRVCNLCYVAMFRWTGRWKISGDNSILAMMLRQYYLPTIKEQLAAESIFLSEMLKLDLNRVKYGES